MVKHRLGLRVAAFTLLVCGWLANSPVLAGDGGYYWPFAPNTYQPHPPNKAKVTTSRVMNGAFRGYGYNGGGYYTPYRGFGYGYPTYGYYGSTYPYYGGGFGLTGFGGNGYPGLGLGGGYGRAYSYGETW